MKTEPEVYYPPPVKFWRTFGILIVLGTLCVLIASVDWLARQTAKLRKVEYH